MSALATERRRPGRPPCCPRELAIRIVKLNLQGQSLREIAAALNEDDLPTPKGGQRWDQSYVYRVLHTRYAQEIRDELKGMPIQQA